MEKKRKIDVSAHLKKVQLLNPSQSLSNQGGFSCSVCVAVFKDYNQYLDHLNSKVHLSNTGVKREEVLKPVGVSSIKSKLEALKKAKEQAASPQPSVEDQLEARLQKAKEDEEAARRARYEKKKELKRKRKLDQA